jgi:hypothetical protein
LKFVIVESETIDASNDEWHIYLADLMIWLVDAFWVSPNCLSFSHFCR